MANQARETRAIQQVRGHLAPPETGGSESGIQTKEISHVDDTRDCNSRLCGVAGRAAGRDLTLSAVSEIAQQGGAYGNYPELQEGLPP